MNISRLAGTLSAVAALMGLCATSNAQLVNGGFENPHFSGAVYTLISDSSVPGWHTTASDHQMEFWSNGFQGVAAYEGSQFVELNANLVSTLYQDITGIAAGLTVGFQFAHRGRSGVDTLRLKITDAGTDNTFGTGDDNLLFSKLYSDGNTAWGFYTDAGNPTITTLGNSLRFQYDSVSAAGGNQSIGNFLDAANFGLGAGSQSSVPEPGAILLGVGTLYMGVMAIRQKRRLKQK